MYYGQEFYIPGSHVPQVFLDADRVMHKRIEKEHPEWLIKRATPKKIPMPFIEGNPKNGPLYVTEDWYYKKKRKNQIRKAKEEKDFRLDIMEVQGRVKVIKGKLAKLNPYKKKDSRKIIELNEELNDCKCMIQAIEAMSGKKVEELEEGSKLERAFNFVKHKVKSAKKKISKWFDRNEELVVGALAVAIPVVIYGLIQAFVPVPIPPPVL